MRALVVNVAGLQWQCSVCGNGHAVATNLKNKFYAGNSKSVIILLIIYRVIHDLSIPCGAHPVHAETKRSI